MGRGLNERLGKITAAVHLAQAHSGENRWRTLPMPAQAAHQTASCSPVTINFFKGPAMLRFCALTLCLVTTGLVACRASPPPLTRAEVLDQLHQCLVLVSKQLPTSKLPPCTKIDTAPLYGIPRAEIAAALGPPTFCMGLGARGSPSGADCPSGLNPWWSFYPVGGTGRDLTCETDEKQRCGVLRWNQGD
jgi:hypothetical protein